MVAFRVGVEVSENRCRTRLSVLFLSISEKTVRKYVWQKTIPYLKIGGHVRFDIGKIHAWLEQREVPTLDEIRYGSWDRRADR
jgi:excisionase family DNA binding protein